MKVALYARESSDDTERAPPITAQLEAGKAWVAAQGHELVNVYADDGYSGGDWRRPDWNQCVKDAKRHQWVALWVWNQDRLARDTEQFLWFYRNLRGVGARIWEDTASDWIDMETLGGRVKHQTMAQAAEIFRLVTSDKVRRKYHLKKERGEKWGRPEKRVDLVLVERLRAKGFGWRRVAERLNEGVDDRKKRVSYQTVRRAWKNVTKSPNGFSEEKPLVFDGVTE